jgi:hypothetical protein
MPPKFARLAAFGAFGVCAVLIVIYAYVAWLSRHTSLGGMLPTMSVVAWISTGLVVLALIGVHVYVARELFYIANGDEPREI